MRPFSSVKSVIRYAPHTCPEKNVRLCGPRALPERFLLAENGDFAKALERWRGTLAWRKQMDADRALQRPNPYFAIIKEGYPHFYHGTDLAGNVVYYELPGLVDYPRLKVCAQENTHKHTQPVW